MQDTTLTIKQTLDIDPEINCINWELNVQDVASTTGRTIAGAATRHLCFLERQFYLILI
jgi:hypothetical protein